MKSILRSLFFVSLFASPTWGSHRGTHSSKRENQYYEQGKFKVLDGTVTKTAHDEHIGWILILFRTKHSSPYEDWFSVQQQNVEIGTHVLLAKPDIPNVKSKDCRAFTPFMFTEEAMHW